MVPRIVSGSHALVSGKILLLATLIAVLPLTRARASGPDENFLDAGALAVLESRAAQAQPREQCYLYTEVLHGLTELAGRQLQSGDDAEAGLTMQHVEQIAAKIQNASAGDAKRLKNAEQLLEHTDRRLSDMSRVASGETLAAVTAALHHVDRVHSELLALVFAH